MDFMEYALQFMGDYGLLALFILLVLDGAMLLPGVPGEVILIIAVATYANDPAGLVLVLAIAVAAAMVGSVLVYLIGRAATGRPGKKRKTVLGVSPKRQERMERLFRRPIGQSLVFFLRLFPLTRVLVSLPAGIARMPFGRFFVLSTLGTVVFYVAFLWLAYEFRRPDSAVAASATSVQAAAYDSTAWTFVEANWFVTVFALLLIGIVMSVRASRRMARDHEESAGSLVGSLSNAALFWGGVAALVGLWLDENLVYRSLAVSGLDVRGLHWGVPFEPASIVGGFAVLAVLVALMIRGIRRTARRTNRQLRLEAAKLEFQGRHRPAAVAPLSESRPEPVTLEPLDDTKTDAGS